MSEKPFSTEQAQSAIDVVIDSIREACVPLIEKLAEIEKQAFTENTEQAIAIIKLRLDVLAKIELKLLSPIKEEYAFIERSVGELQPGDISLLRNNRQLEFYNSIMQGL